MENTHSTSRDTFDFIQKTIDSHDVVLFMKGTQQFPMCGFSGLVVQVLNKYGVSFQDVNVMEDQNIRQGIKDFTEWPTIPQLYLKGEFIGGADIIKEMVLAGEFEEVLAQKGVSYTKPTQQ